MKMPSAKKNKPQLTRRRRLWLIGLGTLALLGLTFAAYCFSCQGRFLPRLYVGQIPVGGLTSMAAQAKLTAAVNDLQAWSVTVDNGEPTKVDLTALADFDIEGMVIAAQRYSAGDTSWQWFVRRVKSLFVRQQTPVVVSVDEVKLRDGLASALYEAHDNDAQEVSLLIRNGKVTVKDGHAGQVVDREVVEPAVIANIFSLTAKPLSVAKVEFKPEFTVADAAFAKKQAERVIATPLVLSWDGGEIGADQATITPWVTTRLAKTDDKRYAPAVAAGAPAADKLLLLDISTERIVSWLALVSKQIDRAPQNATVSFADGSVRLTASGQDGLKVLSDETAAAIRMALLDRSYGQTVAKVAAVVERAAPTVSDDNIAKLGIKELIGRAASDYSGSPENRRKNIALGVKNMSGFILLPGEEWSSLNAIGPVDAAHGFLPEKVILGNRLELQYGGGLCQPASTLFRAILDAGLPITERQNHSRRVSYYEKPSNVKGVRINWDAAYANIGNSLVGYDATVYEPRPDLKFKNDTGSAVLVQAFVTNDKVVTFELYGTNDGRQVSISKGQVLYTKAPAHATLLPPLAYP